MNLHSINNSAKNLHRNILNKAVKGLAIGTLAFGLFGGVKTVSNLASNSPQTTAHAYSNQYGWGNTETWAPSDTHNTDKGIEEYNKKNHIGTPSDSANFEKGAAETAYQQTMQSDTSDDTGAFADQYPHFFNSHRKQLMGELTPRERKDVASRYNQDVKLGFASDSDGATLHNVYMTNSGDIVKGHAKRARRHARKPVIRRRAYRAHKSKRVRRGKRVIRRRHGTKRVRKNKRNNHRNHITTKQHQQINNQIRKDRRVLRSHRAKRNKGYRNSILKAINKLQKSLRK